MLEIQFLPFPILKTSRLLLRQLTEKDAEAVLALRSDTNLMKYIPRPLLKNREEAIDFIANLDDKIEQGIGINWGICLKDRPEKPIGIIGHYRLKPEHYRAEVGYMILEAYSGKGYISEALQVVMTYGFEQMHLHSIEAIVDPNNISSEKVLLKNGFVKEGHLIENEYFEGRFLDSMIYCKRNN